MGGVKNKQQDHPAQSKDSQLDAVVHSCYLETGNR
jgi:hypothetical protein